MVKSIMMPQVGQDIEIGILREWKIKVGDSVKKGDIVAVIDSDKAAFEVEAFDSGTVVELLFREGDEAKVFAPIAYLSDTGQTTTRVTPKMQGEKYPTAESRVVETSPKQKTEAKADFRIISTPSARRMAREHDIHLADLKGSGPNGRIIKQDILTVLERQESVLRREGQKFSETPPLKETVLEKELEEEKIPFSKMRQKIAEKLVYSKQTIPHYYLFLDVDMTDVLVWRTMYNQKSETKISINDILIKAVSAILLQFPKINAHVKGDNLILQKNINIGMAVSVEDGLLVPVVARANEKNTEEIAKITRELALNAKMGVLKSTVIGTFTISNLGMYSVNRFLPIIYPPQVAILGVGKVEQQIRLLGNNLFGIRDIITLSLVCDHRAVDGAYAADFLNHVKLYLEKFAL